MSWKLGSARMYWDGGGGGGGVKSKIRLPLSQLGCSWSLAELGNSLHMVHNFYRLHLQSIAVESESLGLML